MSSTAFTKRPATSGASRQPTQPTNKQFDYALDETVEVTLTGRVIERKDTPQGDQYWIEQTLPDGRTARQWFRARDVYPADEVAA